MNINTANNSKLNVKFGRPRIVGKIAITRVDKQGKEHPDFVNLTSTLARKQPDDCNNCKVKAQRTPRWFRKNMGDRPPVEGVFGLIEAFTTARMFKQRGMTEEAHDVLEHDGINLRYIQIKRRRERDQAQKWKRSGKLIEA